MGVSHSSYNLGVKGQQVPELRCGTSCSAAALGRMTARKVKKDFMEGVKQVENMFDKITEEHLGKLER